MSSVKKEAGGGIWAGETPESLDSKALRVAPLNPNCAALRKSYMSSNSSNSNRNNKRSTSNNSNDSHNSSNSNDRNNSNCIGV